MTKTSLTKSITTINDINCPNSKNSPVKLNKTVTGFPNTPGRTLSESASSNNDYSLVRNHWLNKFSKSIANDININPKHIAGKSKVVASSSKTPSGSLNNLQHGSSSSNVQLNKFNSLKRSFSETSVVIPKKIPKLSVDLTIIDSNLVECPVCSKMFSNEELNRHLDQCLSKTKPCIVCDKNIPENDYQDHVSECCHDCVEEDVFIDSNKKENDIIKEIIISPEKTPVKPSVVTLELCSVCDKPIETSLYHKHLSDCLSEMYQNFENTYIKKSSKCPVCDKDVPESDLSGHLEDCRDLSDIFEDDGNIPIEEGEENKENNCPICAKLVKIEHMNSHIDVCLNIIDR